MDALRAPADRRRSRTAFRPAPRRAPGEGGSWWWVTPTGRLAVEDREYLSWLHERHRAGRLQPFRPPAAAHAAGFDPRDFAHGTKLDLHHTEHPDGGSRRDSDAMVVAVSHAYHMWLEHNRHFERLHERDRFALWAAWSYWGYVNRDPETGEPPPGTAFAGWVLARMAEEPQ